MVKHYEVHDNGGRPFRVDIQGNDVTVWKNMDEYELIDDKYTVIHNPHKEILNFKADTIFVGKKSPQGDYNEMRHKQAEGNSILLQTGLKYVYIGLEIYEFTPVKDDTIEKYYSDIGNNDVPYPFAIGENYVYIMLDKVAIEKSFFDMKKDIYNQYYEAKLYMKMRYKKLNKEEKKQAKERMGELEEKTKKLRVKVLQKRI